MALGWGIMCFGVGFEFLWDLNFCIPFWYTNCWLSRTCELQPTVRLDDEEEGLPVLLLPKHPRVASRGDEWNSVV
jgi:hypothetical protein